MTALLLSTAVMIMEEIRFSEDVWKMWAVGILSQRHDLPSSVHVHVVSLGRSHHDEVSQRSNFALLPSSGCLLNSHAAKKYKGNEYIRVSWNASNILHERDIEKWFLH